MGGQANTLGGCGVSSDGVVPVIVGPTGSGKTGAAIKVALELARDFGVEAEIISADSRAIYKGMDIGTAKPSVSEQRGIPHWGLDLVEPGERFTVADWKKYAEQKICSIRKRGKVPIVVGGTGLYVDALVYGYRFEQKSCSKVPKRGTGEFAEKYPEMPKRGTKEFAEKYPDRVEMSPEYKIFGIKWGSEALRERLKERLNKMFVQELFDETERLVARYGWGSQAMKSDIYEYAWKYMQGELTLKEAKEQCFYRDWHLAKRQMTWFKRNEQIWWLTLDEICPAVLKCIQDDERKR